MAAANPAKLETSCWRTTRARTFGNVHDNTGTAVRGCDHQDENVLFGNCSFVSTGALTVPSARGTWDELLRGGFKATEFNACSSARIPPGRDTLSAPNPQPVSQPCLPCLPCLPIFQANGTSAEADELGKLHIRTLNLDIPSRRIPKPRR